MMLTSYRPVPCWTRLLILIACVGSRPRRQSLSKLQETRGGPIGRLATAGLVVGQEYLATAGHNFSMMRTGKCH